MVEGDVKLIGTQMSPFVIRPRIALNIKSVKYEFLEETFGSKSELLLKSNPVHKKVPVLIHDDKPICESLIIVEYIDETWSSGRSILPSDRYDRAIARFWAAFIDEKLFPAMKTMCFSQSEEVKKAAKEQVVEAVVLLEEAFQKCSKGKAFFGGDEIGFLDISLGSFLAAIKMIENMSGFKLFDEEKTPGLVKWVESFCCDEAVKSVMPKQEKMIEYFKFVASKMAAPPTTE